LGFFAAWVDIYGVGERVVFVNGEFLAELTGAYGCAAQGEVECLVL
jgi:hypothetical protein